MKLGLKRNEVKLVNYTAEWAEEFKKVQSQLIEKTDLSKDRIEHIGSTALEGMPSKPIIDLIVGLDHLEEIPNLIYQELNLLNFKRLKIEKADEIVFARFSDQTHEIKTHYIHLVTYRGELWSNLLFFRDYLRVNETEKNRYMRIKKDYTNQFSTGIKAYTDSKESFVKEIYEKRKSIELSSSQSTS